MCVYNILYHTHPLPFPSHPSSTSPSLLLVLSFKKKKPTESQLVLPVRALAWGHPPQCVQPTDGHIAEEMWHPSSSSPVASSSSARGGAS